MENPASTEAAVMETGIVATYTATELNKTGGKILDDARSGTVRIKRRGVSYVLMREEHLVGLLQAARDGRPESLEDLLRDYDSEKIKAATRGFLNDTPRGKEIL
jgi:hypothetical protein